MKKLFSSFASKEKSDQVFKIAFAFLIFLGFLFRFRHYLAGRSLWLDEAMLALDVLHLSFGELTQQPLPYQQGAPIGFLFFTKAITLLLGDSEYAFRLYSFLASSASLFLMAFLAKRYLNKVGALFSLALFAINLNLIYYSAETKQYMGDVAATLLLLFLLDRELGKEFSRRRFFTLSFVSITILWFSHASLFVVASVGVILSLNYAFQKNKEAFFFSLGNLFLSGISALSLYYFHLRPLSASNFLRLFWEEAFVPIPPSLQWFELFWKGILRNPLALNASLLFFILFLVGGVFLSQRKWQFSLALFLTLFFAFVAGVLQKYPLAERMLLFSTPIFFLLFGAGLDAFSSLIKPKKISLSIVLLLAAYLLYAPFSESFAKFKEPLYREHIRPSMAYLKENLREDDLIYVYYYAEPAFLFYLPKYHLEGVNYIVGFNHQKNPALYLEDIENLHLEGRVWFLFSHIQEVSSINERDFIVEFLNQIAKEDREYRIPDTSVSLYLYNFP